MPIGPIQLIRQATPGQRRTLLAASLGWMLDSFDAMLYALVLTHVMRDLGMTKSTAGLLSTLMLLASGIGGILFGFLADRIGRKRALLLSILTYSLCSFASGLSTSILMLAIFRFILGLGMGGEWNTGATLVAETWPDDLRAKALSIVQSSWAIGFALAALVAGIVLRYANWRMVFFIGILPALVTLWIQNKVPESEMWLEHERDTNREPRSKQSALRSSGKSSSLPAPELVSNICLGKGTASAVPPSAATDEALAAEGRPPHPRSQQTLRLNDSPQSNAPSGNSFFCIFRPPYLKSTAALLFLNLFGLFGWWGLFQWIPAYLSLPIARGGRGFSVLDTTSLLVVLNLFGMFPGYLSFGWVADRLGRRRSFILYLLAAAFLIPLYAVARSPAAMLVLGAIVAFFATGWFSGCSVIASEIYPTSLRARALGFTYTGARAMSSVAPFVIGRVGDLKGLTWAFYLCAAAFLLASAMATQLPETKGRSLE
ncbi:MAG: MFS transporter [Terriglobales bacterium]|jgi:MFS family permease